MKYIMIGQDIILKDNLNLKKRNNNNNNNKNNNNNNNNKEVKVVKK